MASLLPVPKARFFDANGLPLAGGRVFTYLAGTNTLKTSYKEQAGSVPNTNPVILDARGEADIWLVGSYKIVLQNAAGTQQWSVDNVQDIAAQIGTAYGNINNIYAGVATGSANQIIVTPSPALTLTKGQVVRFQVFQGNTGAATLNADGTDRAIRKEINGVLVPLESGDLVANRIEAATWDGTFWVIKGITRRVPAVKTAAYQVVDTDVNGTIEVNSLAAPYIVTLPLISSVPTGFMVRVVKIDTSSNVVIVAASGTDKIGTQSSANLSTQYEFATFQSDGTVWLRSSGATQVQPLVGYISGYTIANNVADATNDIDIGIGSATDSLGQYYLTGTAMTKQLDVVWAVGTNAGFLDTGAVANNTYHIFAIRKDSDGTIDYLASLSPTAPTMPTGYTNRRRIASIVRSGGGILAFVQSGDDFYWKSPTLDINNGATGTAANVGTLTVPTGIVVKVSGAIYVAANAAYAYLSSLSANDLGPDNAAGPIGQAGAGAATNTGTITNLYTNTSAQIRYRLNTNTTLRMSTYGWVDSRGK